MLSCHQEKDVFTCSYQCFDDIKLQVQKSSGVEHEKGFNFYDTRLMRGAWRNEPNPDLCKVECVK